MQTHEAAQHTSATVQPPAVCVALCVDDYGLHEGVNRAVGELAALGRVQATSAMVGGAAWASGLALLRQLDPAQVQVGLHLDLTECALNPALRLPLGRCIAQAYLRRFDTTALLLRGTEGEPVADARRTPRMVLVSNGQARCVQEAQQGALTTLPRVPTLIDAATTADFSRAVMEGRLPAPSPIVLQVEHIVRACKMLEASYDRTLLQPLVSQI